MLFMVHVPQIFGYMYLKYLLQPNPYPPPLSLPRYQANYRDAAIIQLLTNMSANTGAITGLCVTKLLLSNFTKDGWTSGPSSR